MPIDIQITHITKSDRMNPHERITAVWWILSDWTTWKRSQIVAIDLIEKRSNTFFVSVNGNRADVIVSTHNWNKYIKTKNDWEHPNNLLSLPPINW